ncbi:unnamed protein product [Caenorhabditis nigoni]
MTKTLLKTLVRKLERKNTHQWKIINSQADRQFFYWEEENTKLRRLGETLGSVVALKEEVIHENEENIRPVTTKATSYLYEAKNGAVPQVVKEASAAHFYYRGHFWKKSQLGGEGWAKVGDETEKKTLSDLNL